MSSILPAITVKVGDSLERQENDSGSPPDAQTSLDPLEHDRAYDLLAGGVRCPSLLLDSSVLSSSSHGFDIHRDIFVPAISSPPDLHIQKTSANLAGYLGTLPDLCHSPTSPLSPGVSLTDTCLSRASVSRKGTLEGIDAHYTSPQRPINIERRKTRLASAFFLFFVCGWGDGGTAAFFSFILAQFTVFNLYCLSILVTGTILPRECFRFLQLIILPDVVFRSYGRSSSQLYDVWFAFYRQHRWVSLISTRNFEHSDFDGISIALPWEPFSSSVS